MKWSLFERIDLLVKSTKRRKTRRVREREKKIDTPSAVLVSRSRLAYLIDISLALRFFASTLDGRRTSTDWQLVTMKIKSLDFHWQCIARRITRARRDRSMPVSSVVRLPLPHNCDCRLKAKNEWTVLNWLSKQTSSNTYERRVPFAWNIRWFDPDTYKCHCRCNAKVWFEGNDEFGRVNRRDNAEYSIDPAARSLAADWETNAFESTSRVYDVAHVRVLNNWEP